MKRALKSTALPTGLKVRRLPFGIARGIRMHIDFAYESRLYLGMYEVELNRSLRRMCQPGIRTFDVGGQYGYDALVFAKLTNANVVTFECDKGAVERMGHTFRLNPTLAPLIAVVHATVGDGRDGTVTIDEHSAATFAPDLIKVDVEGAELDVLRGATNVLARFHPTLLVEVHGATLEQKCGRLLVEHGYRPRVLSQRRILPDYRPTTEVNRWLLALGPGV